MPDTATGLSIANIILILGLIFKLFALPWYQARKAAAVESENPGHQIETQKMTANNIRVPGASKICRENREKLSTICRDVKNLRDEIKIQNERNEKDHDQMWKRVNEIRDKI